MTDNGALDRKRAFACGILAWRSVCILTTRKQMKGGKDTINVGNVRGRSQYMVSRVGDGINRGIARLLRHYLRWRR